MGLVTIKRGIGLFRKEIDVYLLNEKNIFAVVVKRHWNRKYNDRLRYTPRHIEDTGRPLKSWP